MASVELVAACGVRKQRDRLPPTWLRGPSSVRMITIKLTNVEDVVQKQKGWFVANVVGAFVDLEARVEDIVIEKLRESLAREGIEAVIERRS